MNQRLAAYLEQRILAADPVELIRILYQSAICEVREARRHLEAHDIEARSKSISKTMAILDELSGSLDLSQGEISEGLARLYDYIQGQLIEANFGQSDRPLAEVLGLLTTLAEGWEGVPSQARGPALV
ncbi:MAG: flagellar export chaperone FliS, partial [Acidobacteriota bacterium]|nr:flagellar export chaperone FliS [Acidobacteriota bacterium]